MFRDGGLWEVTRFNEVLRMGPHDGVWCPGKIRKRDFSAQEPARAVLMWIQQEGASECQLHSNPVSILTWDFNPRPVVQMVEAPCL